MRKETEELITEKCMAKKATVATAESCTGGLIAATLINVPGVSEIFREGYITYSNEAKQKILGVRAETLKEYGAVSKETASEMALGCARAAGSDYAVVSTGIAGPGGGTPQKPVGLVYLGCYADGAVYTKECRFHGTRSEIRRQAAESALCFLNEHIDGGIS